MIRTSAGLLLFRRAARGIEVLLVHPGGPYWAGKDEGAWSIPKGEFGPDEEPLAAARREFEEETGFAVSGEFLPLQPVHTASGKLIHAWALEAELDATQIRSNTFALEWPPRSGRMVDFPEVDRAGWFALNEAGVKINKGQLPLLDQLRALADACTVPR